MKTLLATTLVTLALSVSATVAYAGAGRQVIPPSQQNFMGIVEGPNAVIAGAGRQVIPPSQQNFKGIVEGPNAVIAGAGRQVIPPAGQHG
jgi:hypothetical protein